MAAPLMTPAMQAAAPAGSSMLGCITLIKKQTAATGLAAAAATGRSKRSRAAVAAVPEEQDGDATAIMVTTDGERMGAVGSRRPMDHLRIQMRQTRT